MQRSFVRQMEKVPLRPNCINFEHFHLLKNDRKPLFNQLEENGYLLNYDQWNILAVQKSFLAHWVG